MTEYDLVIKGARINDESNLVDIGISEGKIARIDRKLSGRNIIDVNGDVVVPSFIESHIHLDKALLERVRPNLEGTLASAIRITGELKKGFQYEEVLSRSRNVLEMLIAHGTTYVRAHPDTDPLGGLTGFKVMLQLKKEFANAVDMQIVAFPQEGLIKLPGALEILEEAMKLGADVVGGCPYNENSYEDTKKHIDLVFDLAKKYNKDIDFHADFGDNPEDLRYRSIDYIIEKTLKEGYHGRVTVGHMTSLSSIDPSLLKDTITRMAEAGINIVALPATDLYLSGRGDLNKVRRGVINPKPFVEGGVNVAFSSNNIRNAFTPFGKGDLLMIGSLYEHAAQLGSVSDQKLLLKMITENAAKILRISDKYGLEEGKQADMVVLGTKTLSDIFIEVPVRRYVIKRGKIVYRSELLELKNWGG
ncbi:MAG: amidohydrolase family protein [Candidatus Micrarchaeia archaeon]